MYFVVCLWMLGLSSWAALAQPPLGPGIPFHFIHTCVNTITPSPTSTPTLSSTTLPPPNNSPSTIFLFFDPTALSPSPPSCLCTLNGRGIFNVSRVWERGQTTVLTPTMDNNDNGNNSSMNKMPDCVWTGAGKGDSCRKSGSGTESLTVLLKGDPAAKPGAYTFLLVHAPNGTVDVSCRGVKEPTDTTPSVITTSATANFSTTPSAANNSHTTGNPPSAPPSPSPSATPVLTDTPIDNPSTTLPNLQPSSTSHTRSMVNTTPTSQKVNATTSAEPKPGAKAGVIVETQMPATTEESTSVTESSKGLLHQPVDNQSPLDTGIHYSVLGVGVVLSLVSLTALAILLRQRKRREKKDAEKAPARKRRKGGSSSPSGAAGKSAAMANSRDSLISQGHNYEDVSEDGLSGVVVQKQPPRKPSAPTPSSSSNYSHIHAPKTSRPSIPTSPAPKDGQAEDVEDDYNRLDLGRSGRQNSLAATATTSSATPTAAPDRLFYVGDEDDDYMDIGSNAGSDIYEAVDGDSERTPLCPRRGGGDRKEEYTDCVTAKDGKILVCNGAVNKPSGSEGPSAASSSENCRPTLPTCPPPKLLNTANSRSLDTVLTEDEPKRSSHRHSKSLDLKYISKCAQRDLFLEQFRSQGDGAESSSEANSKEPEDDYTDVPCSSDAAACSSQESPANPTASPSDSAVPDPIPGSPEKVVFRRKSRNSKKKLNPEGRVSMIDHLKEINTELLELQTAVRRSMEIKDDELIMIDNVIYGTLPRNLSLPTTEL